MRGRTLGICYPQSQDILMSATQDYCCQFNNFGFEGDAINVGNAEDLNLLDKYLKRGDVDFCFGLQGVGSNLISNGENLWTKFKTPFVGLHFDNPCHNPLNHVNESLFVGNLYYYKSFLETRQRFFDVSQMTGLLQQDTYELPLKSRVNDFAARSIRFLYLKSGGDLQIYIDNINRMPPQVRDGVWQQVERAVKNPNLLLADLVQEVFQATGHDRRKQEKQFWGVVQAMDLYLRLRRAIDFVNWLKFQKGAVIVGDGWGGIDRTGVRAEFCSSMDSKKSYQLYNQTQFICNTNPYSQDITHERVVFGLLSGCCVITDTNAWWDKHFVDIPSLLRFNWCDSLNDQLTFGITNFQGSAEALRAAMVRASQHFTGGKSIYNIVDFAQNLGKLARSKMS